MKTEDIKSLYDSDIQHKFLNQYEHNRWFADPVSRGGYTMTRHTIESCVVPHIPEQGVMCELGPGPGTWTKVVLEYRPYISIDLIDISEKMLSQAQANLARHTNVTFTQADFLYFETDKTYDVFFSSRAIEYFPDKEPVIKKISTLVKKGGVCSIVTKMPKYWAYILTGKQVPVMHRYQISDRDLVALLRVHGFKIVDVKPAMMTFPLCKQSWLNSMVFTLFGRMRVNILSRLLCESYCVTAIKI